MNTKILKVDPKSIKFDNNDRLIISDSETEKNLKEAANLISKTNNVVAFPTETVYGLGGNSFNDESIKNIYKAKSRPSDNPLISHISSKSQIKEFFNIDIPEIYLPLVNRFWPGPLTILIPVDENSKISRLTTVNQPTAAVRMPVHPVARALIHLSNVPIAAPSANASTRPSPTLASHVYHDLNGKIPLILDGGPSDIGVESTVVDGLSDPPMLLRPGGISLEQIKKYGGDFWQTVKIAKKVADENEIVKTPGMKYKHYSPTARVILVEHEDSIDNYIKENDLANKKLSLLTAENFNGDNFSGLTKNLGKTKKEISSNLFKYLREFDEEHNVDIIFIESIDETNEGLAIMNRLKKAATTHI